MDRGNGIPKEREVDEKFVSGRGECVCVDPSMLRLIRKTVSEDLRGCCEP